MEKEFVPYELALKLKELGFNEECFNVYDELGFIQDEKEMDELNLIKLNAPLWQQAFDWFREEHGLCYFINFSGFGYCSGWEDLGNNEHGFENYKTYEEARLACLEKLIELTNQNNKIICN